jgi:hypothetical protein
MSDELSTLLSSQHRRLVATVMGHIEREVYPMLQPAQRRELRECVIRAAGTYHDTALDCLKAGSTGEDSTLRNERFYDLIEQIHRAVALPPRTRS